MYINKFLLKNIKCQCVKFYLPQIIWLKNYILLLTCQHGSILWITIIFNQKTIFLAAKGRLIIYFCWNIHLTF